MQAIAIAALYMLVTAPFLVLLIKVHATKSDYLGLFLWGIALQLIPIGLIYFPLGFVGWAILLLSLAGSWKRNRQFRLSGLDNPTVGRQWSLEYGWNLLAFGLATQQKLVALLFVALTGRLATEAHWGALVMGSTVLWAAIGLELRQEGRRRPPMPTD